MTAPIPTQHSIDHITFDVVGSPAPQGSKRHVGHGILIESSKHVRPWREAVKQAALDTLHASPDERIRHGYPFNRDPVAVVLEFTLPRPRHHYRSGKYAHELHHLAPAYVATRPDIDKLIRSTLDALSDAAMWFDDAQVAKVDTAKRYSNGDPPGVDITISRLR